MLYITAMFCNRYKTPNPCWGLKDGAVPALTFGGDVALALASLCAVDGLQDNREGPPLLEPREVMTCSFHE